jgi:predicted TPR repeat methyltransferase
VTEHWARVYRETPEIFAAFARAEDPAGRVVARLGELSEIARRRALEIGCGTGRYAEVLSQTARTYLGLDRSEAMLGRARRVSPSGAAPCLAVADGERLPVADGGADVVIAAWVLAYLKPATLERVMAEIDRVTSGTSKSGAWAVENAGQGEFHELRRPAGERDREGLARLIEGHGFEVVDTIDTEIVFPSEAEAERVLTALLGDAVGGRLRDRPTRELGHRVVILHRPASRR